jgi:hypothetical protein
MKLRNLMFSIILIMMVFLKIPNSVYQSLDEQSFRRAEVKTQIHAMLKEMDTNKDVNNKEGLINHGKNIYSAPDNKKD